MKPTAILYQPQMMLPIIFSWIMIMLSKFFTSSRFYVQKEKKTAITISQMLQDFAEQF